MTPRIKQKFCVICGAFFLGGPTAQFCPVCRVERIRQSDRERHKRKLAGKLRHLGSTDLCAICSKPYEVKSGYQKYCETCSISESKRRRHESWLEEYYNNPAKRHKYLQRSRQWAELNQDRMAEILRKSYERNLGKIKERRRKMYGVKLRSLGRTEVCPKCKSEFVVKERNQKYCADCKNKLPKIE